MRLRLVVGAVVVALVLGVGGVAFAAVITPGVASGTYGPWPCLPGGPGYTYSTACSPDNISISSSGDHAKGMGTGACRGTQVVLAVSGAIQEDYGCQAMFPSSYGAPRGLEPIVAISDGWTDSGSSTWTHGGYPASIAWQTMAWGGNSYGDSFCEPTSGAANSAEEHVWTDGHTSCSNGSGSDSDFSTTGWAFSMVWRYYAVGSVESYNGGNGSLDSYTGTSFQAVQFSVMVTFNADPVTGHTGSGTHLGHPVIQPSCEGSGGDGVELSCSPALNGPSLDGGFSWMQVEFSGANYQLVGFYSFRDYATGSSEQDANIPGDWFAGGSASAVPCANLSLNGTAAQGDGTFTYVAGQAYSFSVTWKGAATSLAVDPSDQTPSVSFGTFTIGADASVVTATGSPQVVSVTPAVGGGHRPVVYCLDSASGYSTHAPITTQTGSPSGTSCLSVGCASDLGACLSQIGTSGGFWSQIWSALNPVSWLPDAVQALSCLGQWLFVPQSINSAGLTDPITQHVPGLWVSDATGAVTSLVSSVTSGVGASPCDSPVINPQFHTLTNVGSLSSTAGQVKLPAPESLGCTAASSFASVGDLFGWRGAIRDLEVLVIWLAVVWRVWRMNPWTKGDDALGVLSGGGEFVEDADGNLAAEFDT